MNSKLLSDEEAVRPMCECGHSAISHVYSSSTGKTYCRACNCKDFDWKLPTEPKLPETFEEFWSETVKWGHASDYSDTYQNKKALAHRAWNAGRGER